MSKDEREGESWPRRILPKLLMVNISNSQLINLISKILLCARSKVHSSHWEDKKKGKK